MLNLDTSVEDVPKIGLAYQKKLKKLGIKTVQDLLFYFPARYDDFSDIIPINKVQAGQIACVQGKIISIDQTHTFKRGMDITEVIIEDEMGQIPALWFNQPYLAQSLKEDQYICLAGKVSLGKDGMYLNNPAYERIYDPTSDIRHLTSDLTHTGRIIPVYSETKGVTSRWLRYVLKPLLVQFCDQVPEILPPEIVEKQKFLPASEAVWQAHFPESFEFADAAKARFAFEDLLLLQLSVLKEKAKLQQNSAQPCPMNTELMKEFTKSLPFQLTDSQRQCSFQILKDLEKSVPMSRLLQGDVGSGKTVVATMAALSVVKNGHQAAFMAPTEILARQHFNGISAMLAKFNVKVELLTGKTPKRGKLLKRLAEGEIDILIGTQALISKGVKFKSLALIVLDEQHRFGVAQRAALGDGQTQTGTQTNADTEFLHGDITYKIRKCLFDLRKEMGLGHKEVIYQKALAEKFTAEGLKFEQEKPIPIMYSNKKIGVYQPDFIVEDKIILELKALPFTGPTEKKQLWNYLKGTSYKVALLANFSPNDIEIDRVVYDTARSGLRQSASSLRESANKCVPHLLSMTATPIPRTLALTVYGDLDLSLIKEMPKNRKKIITTVVGQSNRQKAYEFIKHEVAKGRGVFVICPKIETKDAKVDGSPTSMEFVPRNYSFGFAAKEEIKSVKQEYEKLSKEIFPDLRITMLYGKMKAQEKELIMQDFKKGQIDILLSTSVVEVGVDVPRATVMMIEGAERFGLSQLHQFRGRVGRSDMQSYCFLFTTEESQQNRKRLKVMEKSSNGFELAEEDLKIRGPGQLYGTQQWGLPDVAMQNLSNIFLIEKTRSEAKELLEKDPALKNYPLLKARLKNFEQKIHFE